MENEQPHYDQHDYGVMASNLFHELCKIDTEDRRQGRPPAWHDIMKLMKKLSAYLNKVDTAFITKALLKGEEKIIEYDASNTSIRLTDLGRQNCDMVDSKYFS